MGAGPQRHHRDDGRDCEQGDEHGLADHADDHADHDMPEDGERGGGDEAREDRHEPSPIGVGLMDAVADANGCEHGAQRASETQEPDWTVDAAFYGCVGFHFPSFLRQRLLMTIIRRRITSRRRDMNSQRFSVAVVAKPALACQSSVFFRHSDEAITLARA